MLLSMVTIVNNIIFSTIIMIRIMTLIVNRDNLPDHFEHDKDDEDE